MSSDPTLKKLDQGPSHERAEVRNPPFQIEAGSIPSGESWGSPEFALTIELDGIPSGEAFGTPILLSQLDFPLNDYQLTGGPDDEQLRHDLYRDFLRLARKISAIENSGAIPPAEAADRWIQRVTRLSGGEVGLQDLLKLSRDFAHGHSLHLLESGKRSLSLEFADFARGFDSLLNRDQPWQTIEESAQEGAESASVREDPDETVTGSDSESGSVNVYPGKSKSPTNSNPEAAGEQERPATPVPGLDPIQPESPKGRLAGDNAPIADIKREPSSRREHRRRGRKGTFSAEQIDQARKLKQAGESNNEAAKVLYNTSSPTENQRRGVSTILKHHSEKNTLKEI